MLRWLPRKLNLLSTALTSYACLVLQEADVMDRLFISSMTHRERRMLRKGGEDWTYLSAPNRAPLLGWQAFPEGEAFLPPLLPRAGYLDRDGIVALLTTRGGPLHGCRPLRLADALESPAKTARLGYICCLKAVREEGMGGPEASASTVPAFRSVADYIRWRESCRRAEPRDARKPPIEQPYESSAFSKSLVLLTLGSLGMQLQHRCERCFRLGVADLRRCFEHSQSDAASFDGGPSKSKRRAAARTGERVGQLLGMVAQPRDLSVARLARASQLSGALFDKPIGETNKWKDRINESVRASPQVQARLPVTFNAESPRSALRALRSSLDPNEYDPWAWPEKILAASTWFSTQKQVAPGKPPKSPQAKTLERLADIDRFRSHGFGDEAIAAELKISVRALRLTLQRHGKA